MCLSSDASDLLQQRGESGEDVMFSLVWAEDLITAAKAACVSFQPGANPVQGAVLPLWWPAASAPGALPILL